MGEFNAYCNFLSNLGLCFLGIVCYFLFLCLIMAVGYIVFYVIPYLVLEEIRYRADLRKIKKREAKYGYFFRIKSDNHTSEKP